MTRRSVLSLIAVATLLVMSLVWRATHSVTTSLRCWRRELRRGSCLQWKRMPDGESSEGDRGDRCLTGTMRRVFTTVRSDA